MQSCYIVDVADRGEERYGRVICLKELVQCVLLPYRPLDIEVVVVVGRYIVPSIGQARRKIPETLDRSRVLGDIVVRVGRVMGELVV